MILRTVKFGAGNLAVVVCIQVFDEASGALTMATDTGKKITFKIAGGFIEVLNNEVSLLVRGVKELVK